MLEVKLEKLSVMNPTTGRRAAWSRAQPGVFEVTGPQGMQLLPVPAGVNVWDHMRSVVLSNEVLK